MTQVQAAITVSGMRCDKVCKNSRRHSGTVRVGSTPVDFDAYVPNEILAALGVGQGDAVVITIAKA